MLSFRLTHTVLQALDTCPISRARPRDDKVSVPSGAAALSAFIHPGRALRAHVEHDVVLGVALTAPFFISTTSRSPQGGSGVGGLGIGIAKGWGQESEPREPETTRKTLNAPAFIRH